LRDDQPIDRIRLFGNELLTMTGANRAGDRFGHRNVDIPPIRCRPGEAMGTVVVFSEARRAPRQSPPPVRAGAATVVILPVGPDRARRRPFAGLVCFAEAKSQTVIRAQAAQARDAGIDAAAIALSRSAAAWVRARIRPQ
jgi:hypothetical protein